MFENSENEKVFNLKMFKKLILHLKMTACGEARIMVASQAAATINLRTLLLAHSNLTQIFSSKIMMSLCNVCTM